eukprot:gene12094-biopygen19928
MLVGYLSVVPQRQTHLVGLVDDDDDQLKVGNCCTESHGAARVTVSSQSSAAVPPRIFSVKLVEPVPQFFLAPGEQVGRGSKSAGAMSAARPDCVAARPDCVAARPDCVAARPDCCVSRAARLFWDCSLHNDAVRRGAERDVARREARELRRSALTRVRDAS